MRLSPASDHLLTLDCRMESTCLPHTEFPQTTRLFADFIYHFDRVRTFYDHPPGDPQSFRSAAQAIDYPADRRAALVSLLRRQNGDSPALEALAQPGTLAVVTGQQVGLFSGPAYTIYKALTAAKLARSLTASGLPAVPVFWLASEDHDFAEVNHCWIFDSAHQPLRITVPEDQGPPDRPVGEIQVRGNPIESLRQSLVGLPFADETAALVEHSYPPGQTFASGFRDILQRLLPACGLLYLDPLDPAARRLAAPMLCQALSMAADLARLLLERNAELIAAGYHAQVYVDEQTSLLFLLDNGRRLSLPGRLAVQELLDRAEQLSPNALLRPVVQDYMLPTVAWVGGPAELAYLAQAQVLYRALLGRTPVAVHRASFTLLDQRAGRLLQRYGLGLPDVFRGEHHMGDRISRKLTPPALGASLAATQSRTAELLDHLAPDLAGFDATLAAAFDKSRRKILYQLSKIERKVAREALRRDDRALRDAAFLSALINPHKHPQERFYSILPFLARYGPPLIDQLYDAIDLDCPDHRVLVL